MAFVHCHSCEWEQDDFYSENGYNPAKYLASWNKQLLGSDIDKQFTDDAGFIRRNGTITTREVIAREYERFAQRIRDMKWITYEQWDNDPNKWKCPKCGAKLSVD